MCYTILMYSLTTFKILFPSSLFYNFRLLQINCLYYTSLEMTFISDGLIESFLKDCFQVLNDSRFFIHLLLAWAVSLVFCWKVLPVFSSTRKEHNIEQNSKDDVVESVEKIDLDATQLMMPPSKPRPRMLMDKISKYSPDLPTPVKLNDSKIDKDSKRFLSQLEHEICGKAKEAGKHPSYTSLVLTLVHNYNVDINKPVLTNNYSIFHCACLSCNLELVTSLTPMANIHQVTSHGDSPLYLAVYAASHRIKSMPSTGQDGLSIVRHLLANGGEVNQANQAGWTPLHQASRLGHDLMVRLLLDWGAEMRSVHHNSSIRSHHDLSIISRCSSVVTRSMSKKKEKVEDLNKSLFNRVL